jgi:glycosyltransferase involved in cell wall biosynthesis
MGMPLPSKASSPPRLLVVQRLSLSHSRLKSRSIGARFGPLLDYMERQGLLQWQEILETEIGIEDFRRHDAVLLNKHSSTRGLEIIHTAKALGLRCIYDLDDWILDLPSYSVTNLDEDVLANIVRMIREADVVSVSNPVLQHKLKYIRPESTILRNGFDHEALPYGPLLQKESSKPRILFSNTDGIKLVAHRKPFLQQLVAFLERYPEVELDFWGDHFPEIGRIPRLRDNGFAPNKTYKQAIRDAGYWFAVVPLGGQEDPETLFFNSCKSCIKYIDYGSLGIPGIYSNSPVYSEVVQHGRTGLLVDNRGDEWLQAMIMLHEDGELRQKIRAQALDDCITNFGLQASAQKLLEMIAKG